MIKSVLMAVSETGSCDSDCGTQISHGSEILGSQHGEGENPGLENGDAPEGFCGVRCCWLTTHYSQSEQQFGRSWSHLKEPEWPPSATRMRSAAFFSERRDFVTLFRFPNWQWVMRRVSEWDELEARAGWARQFEATEGSWAFTCGSHFLASFFLKCCDC